MDENVLQCSVKVKKHKTIDLFKILCIFYFCRIIQYLFTKSEIKRYDLTGLFFRSEGILEIRKNTHTCTWKPYLDKMKSL